MSTAARAATPAGCGRRGDLDAYGEVLDEASEAIGVAMNNVAEYRGLLLGLARARELGADEVEVVNDSELVAKQVNGATRSSIPT